MGGNKKEGKSNGTTMVPNSKDNKNVNTKSKFWAYFWWLFGGFLGAHHLYLERDDHAVIYFCTLGGYFGIGWLRDIYKIPSYVADANDQPEYLHSFKHQVRAFPRVIINFLSILFKIVRIMYF